MAGLLEDYPPPALAHRHVNGSLSAFQLIYVTTGGSPATRTLAMFVYQVAFDLSGGTANNVGRQGLASAMSMLLSVYSGNRGFI
jgi:ABC-type sugar transport system permease subunit